jgi:dienelactone hydrolase
LTRAVWLGLAALLALPTVIGLTTVVLSTAFLVEFFSGGARRPLTALTPPAVSRPLEVTSAGVRVPTDVFRGASFRRAPGLVLVHGITPRGKNDPQLRAAARLLARTGWVVAVPTVPGLTALRLRPDDAAAVAGAARALHDGGHRPVAVLAVSLGAAPALLAAAQPEVAPMLAAVLAVGGYASARELLRYTLTGAYDLDGRRGARPVDETAIDVFARANGELLDGAGARLVANRDPARVDALLAGLSPDTQRLLDALSPEQRVAQVRAPLFLLHGQDDPAVPYTESVRLERAARTAGRPVRAAILGAIVHVDARDRATWRDLGRAWAMFYAFRVAATRTS